MEVRDADAPVTLFCCPVALDISTLLSSSVQPYHETWAGFSHVGGGELLSQLNPETEGLNLNKSPV